MNNRFQVQIIILSIAVLNGCTPTRVSDQVKLVDIKVTRKKYTPLILLKFEVE